MLCGSRLVWRKFCSEIYESFYLENSMISDKNLGDRY